MPFTAKNPGEKTFLESRTCALIPVEILTKNDTVAILGDLFASFHFSCIFCVHPIVGVLFAIFRQLLLPFVCRFCGTNSPRRLFFRLAN